MAAGVNSFSGPIDDSFRLKIRLHSRAQALGFERLDFGDSDYRSDGRLWWRTPAGRVLYVTDDELAEILDRNIERWWAWEAAHWTAE